jgi:hypothetical protein
MEITKMPEETQQQGLKSLPTSWSKDDGEKTAKTFPIPNSKEVALDYAYENDTDERDRIDDEQDDTESKEHVEKAIKLSRKQDILERKLAIEELKTKIAKLKHERVILEHTERRLEVATQAMEEDWDYSPEVRIKPPSILDLVKENNETALASKKTATETMIVLTFIVGVAVVLSLCAIFQ